MKKTLLSIGLLVASSSVFAQSDLTYVGNDAKFFVSSDALVFSGGSWTLDSPSDKTVENWGNIIIDGFYKTGANDTNDGKEFVNMYKDASHYGQVIIKGVNYAHGDDVSGSTNARMTIQRPAISDKYKGNDFGVAFPFKDDVTYMMKSFGKSDNEFKGDCPYEQTCGNKRYAMSLYQWNNKKLEFDATGMAIPQTNKLKAGAWFAVNFREEAGLQSAMKGDNNIISYKGTPDPRAIQEGSLKETIKGKSETEFANLGYNDWKKLLNNYNEAYETYLGHIDSSSKLLNKNIFRFGNPYTSNLDLSDINSWLTITNASINQITSVVKDITILKDKADYEQTWSYNYGGKVTGWNIYKAKYDGLNWTGNANALIVEPTETFQLIFPVINPTAFTTGKSVEIQVKFNDTHKTFEFQPNPAYKGNTTQATYTLNAFSNNVGSLMSVFTPKIFATNYSSAVNANDFYQNEILLVKDGAIQADPVYLVGAGYYKETPKVASVRNTNSMIYLNNTTSDMLRFDSNEFVGKPMELGFNKLESGASYELRFNLYESSIFNKVKDLSAGKFFIKDKSNNRVDEVSSTSPYKFVASNDMANRFEIYWKSVNSTNGDGSTLKADAFNTSETKLYNNANIINISFEKAIGKANVEVYDLAGRLVFAKTNIDTNTDLALNTIREKGVYIVKVVYANGVVKSLKTIK